MIFYFLTCSQSQKRQIKQCVWRSLHAIQYSQLFPSLLVCRWSKQCLQLLEQEQKRLKLLLLLVQIHVMQWMLFSLGGRTTTHNAYFQISFYCPSYLIKGEKYGLKNKLFISPSFIRFQQPTTFASCKQQETKPNNKSVKTRKISWRTNSGSQRFGG